MARTIEQVLEVQMGKMQLMLASYIAQTEALLEQIQTLQVKITNLEAAPAAPAPAPDGHQPRTPRLVEKES